MLNTYTCFNYQIMNTASFAKNLGEIQENLQHVYSMILWPFSLVMFIGILLNLLLLIKTNLVNNKNTSSVFNKNLWLKTILTGTGLTVLLNQNTLIVNTVLLIILLLVVSIIITYFINFNTCLLNTVTGSKTGKTLFDSILFDFINILSFNIRFLVQYVRILLISVSLVLLVEFFFQNTTIDSNFNIMNVFIYTLRLVFEYMDLLLITAIQFTSFNTMLFWLLNFMFSNNNNNLMENLCEDKLF